MERARDIKKSHKRDLESVLPTNSGRKEVRRSHLLKTACQGKGIATGSLGNGHDMKEADSGSP